MNLKDYDLHEKMNINSNCIVINQCSQNSIKQHLNKGKNLLYIDTTDRGLSKSRNLGIRNCSSKHFLIADDDLIYNDNVESIVIDAFKKYSDAAVIGFYVRSTNIERPTNKPDRSGRLTRIESMKLSSFQLAFNNDLLIESGIIFNEAFGAGSGNVKMGEENILLYKLISKGYKVYYHDVLIGEVNHAETTWFTGIDSKYLSDRGAIFFEMSKKLYMIYILQFSIRKRYLYKKKFSLFQSIKLMYNGAKKQQLLNNVRN